MKTNEEISRKHLSSTEPDPYVVRISWSLDSYSTQLGEAPFSYGCGGTGKKSANSQFETVETSLQRTITEKWMGIAFPIQKEAFGGGQALYPYVLAKSCTMEFNFRQRAEPYCSTTRAIKHAASSPSKECNILGTSAIMDKMQVMGQQRDSAGSWDILTQQATQCLNRIIHIAAHKRRNYILRKTNVYGSAQRPKLRPSEGFQHKAIVICPTDRT
ncbi:hypothetical protein P7K49_007195 [Saguinus oedipus]|uniref:Uncharacterized protein n=1 Tax=Saguinus oedipus TaxID=9490 RepID=A0ABQ9VVQ0_SAGOE|nr:hypothetical protein P7K49_007195 [Saguinus oedipus]